MPEQKYLVCRTNTDQNDQTATEVRTFHVTKPDFDTNLSESRPVHLDNDEFLKFDKDGYLKPSSIIGDIDDFVKTITKVKESTEHVDSTTVDQKDTFAFSKRGVSYADGFPAGDLKLATQVSFIKGGTDAEKQPPRTAPVGTCPENQANEADERWSKSTFDQNSALDNWQKKMAERKKIHGRISKLVSRPTTASTALMNSADQQRKINEVRILVDKGIPAVDYGKGYRKGSEFWQQHENIGDDVTGLKMTLTKSERGVSNKFIEKISKPTDILDETTSQGFSRSNTRGSQKFFTNPYLKSRLKELEKFKVGSAENILGSGENFRNLIVTGRNSVGDETEYQPQVTGPPQTAPAKACASLHGPQFDFYKSSTPADNKNRNCASPLAATGPQPTNSTALIGPILRINNKVAKYNDRADIEERVLLQSDSDGTITKSVLKLENVGSTSISFHFRRVNNDSINMQPPKFFFNRLGGCVLPGETANFPFHFRSTKPGIFSESWVLVTEPCLLNGGTISIRLYAIAYDTDKMQERRVAVKHKLLQRESLATARKQLDNILVKAFTISEEKSKLGDLSFAEDNAEKTFDFSNSAWKGKVDFTYRHDAVSSLERIWKRCYGEGSHLKYKSRPATGESGNRSGTAGSNRAGPGGPAGGNTGPGGAPADSKVAPSELDAENAAGALGLDEAIKNAESEIPKWDFDILKLKNLSIENLADDEAELALETINNVVDKLRDNSLWHSKRGALLLLDESTAKKMETKLLFGDMINKFFEAATELKKTMKLEAAESKTKNLENGSSRPTSRTSSGKTKKERDQKDKEKNSNPASREANERPGKSTKNKHNNQAAAIPELPVLNENGLTLEEQLALDLKVAKEEMDLKKSEYNARLHSVCDGIFGEFVENMLDNFETM